VTEEYQAMTAEELITEAQQLPRDQIAYVALALWQEALRDAADDQVSPAEIAELDATSQLAETDPSSVLSLDEALRRIDVIFGK